MDKLLVQGSCKMHGEIPISCAKNAYLPILAGVVLSDKPIHLKNLPRLRDIQTMNKILETMGVKITGDYSMMTYDASTIHTPEATYELVKTMRASIFILGPLLARFKSAKVSLPGGCAIGSRPIDIHLKNLEKMGAEIELTEGYVKAHTGGLKGTKLVLSFPSVGATENLMMAAVFADGETLIENAAMEPEIDDLANFLNAMGAKVTGAGTPNIKIQGVKSLNEVTYEAIPDRIETATYLMAALATGSELTLTRANPSHLDKVIDTLTEMGAKLELGKDYIKTYPSKLKGVSIDTAPYPGFPTDCQAQLVTLATQASSPSIISENIFENRFMHVPELNRMGAKIELKGNTAIVPGNTPLVAAPVMCTDLRASAALIMAALCAKGTTEVQRIYHLERGYEKFDQKFKNAGAIMEKKPE